MTALRGVNLGGWLVLEEWMTPRLFDGTGAHDEYSFMQSPDARQKLREHQKTWIEERDFKWLHDHGIDAVRLPIGYWILDGDDPYVSSIGRLDWAVTMCEKYKLKLVICLHGAPGSQNGQDSSGRKTKARWYQNAAFQQQTIEYLMRLAGRYGKSSALYGIELLNEPRAGLLQVKLRRFYNQAYRRLVVELPATVAIIFSDAFTPRLMANAIWQNHSHRTVMDIHWYHFATWKRLPLRPYYWIVKLHGRLIRSLRRTQPVIIGEWNGIIAGQVLDKYPESQHASIVAEHIQHQLAAYESAEAWFYWNYKTQERGIWHFRSLVEDGVISLGDR